MVCTMQIGQVGLDIDMNSPQTWDDTTDSVEWNTTLEIILRGDNLTETLVLRSELMAQTGQLVPVLYTPDPTAAGYYWQTECQVSKQWSDAALQAPGFLRGTIGLKRVGSYSNTELQSLLSLVSAAEDFATTPSYSWAPAIGAKAVDVGGVTATLIERDGASGTMQLATDIASTLTKATWSQDPANYYDGGCQIWAADRLRTGRDMPMDPTDWYLNNDMMQLRPSVFQGATDGGLEVRFHDGTSWGLWVPFQINHAGVNTIPTWDFVSILRGQNHPHAVTVRLVRDAAETPTSTYAKHELDLTLKRGGRLITGVYKFTGSAATHALEQSDGVATTRPGGVGTSYVAATALISGDKILWGTPRDFTLTGSEIQLDVASTSMPFWIGAAVDNASSGTGNGPADLAEQYVGQVTESIRGVSR